MINPDGGATMMMGFIVTCFNREAYWPHLRRILAGYTHLRPRIAYCYNGADPSHPCDLRLANPGHSEGDLLMTLAGYRWLLDRHGGQGLCRFMKLSVDSWPCDEAMIVSIARRMEALRACYAGAYWHWNRPGSLSTDVFMADTRFGNVFAELPRHRGCGDFETLMQAAVQTTGRPYLIPERHPVHLQNRFGCDQLKWTMSHDLQENVRYAAALGLADQTDRMPRVMAAS